MKEEQKEIFNEHIRDWSFDFHNLEKRINSDNLINSDNWNTDLVDLFKPLSYGSIKEVWKYKVTLNQI